MEDLKQKQFQNTTVSFYQRFINKRFNFQLLRQEMTLNNHWGTKFNFLSIKLDLTVLCNLFSEHEFVLGFTLSGPDFAQHLSSFVVFIKKFFSQYSLSLFADTSCN